MVPSIRLGHSRTAGRLVSLPFLDYGGILADTQEAETMLLEALLNEAGRVGLPLEIRCRQSLLSLKAPRNEKAAMLLNLQGVDEQSYWKRLDAKVRNQVRKAEKSGVSLRRGKGELLDDFYAVFCANMRDLGSPVHGRKLFSAVLTHFPEAEIVTAYLQGQCIGGMIALFWKDGMIIPWASTLRKFRSYCPNNALYWEALRKTFAEKRNWVDFGRSTRDEGTFRFKQQWLAAAEPLPWYQFDREGTLRPDIAHLSAGGLSWAAKVWSWLPLPVANALGPRLRRRLPA